ncbi:class II aldolase/adducin family protein [Micromonospora sp. NBC_01796]|uniref:class II aldolase/adducin family protein n=1 Tax=Micromonospora sp. NBC_01796 TaxID=2975987 RepID=UPI002DD8A76A|nr:class II aldolase/adducin family protein [Micromonospora sp. NBC_01796]WSA88717.1 class II aldolase/adducin family protein [Micromonospora sp. NBC_01796]
MNDNLIGDLCAQLARVGRDVVRSGLVVGSGGNLSVRVSGTDSCWVTAAGTWLDRLDRSDFVQVGITDGAVRDESGSGMPAPVPTSELALHLATYRARPDVRAIVHLHPQHALLLDALGERIRLVTTDHAFYLRRVALVPFRPPGSAELAELAASAAADGTNCLVLSRHGCSVLAESVELAHKRAVNLEEAARLTYHALVAGRLDDLTELPPDLLDRI